MRRNSSLHIAFVSAFQYPDGGAAASRHLAMAAGLIERGHAVTMYLLTQREAPKDIHPLGIHWRIVAVGPDARSRMGWRVGALWRLRAELNSLKPDSKFDAILAVDRDPVLLAGISLLARRSGVPAIHELTEYPDTVFPKGLLGLALQLVYSRVLLSRLDGILVISRALEEYVRQRSSAPIRRVGPVVDAQTVVPGKWIEVGSEIKIGYAGSLSQQKDGVLDLVHAAGLAARRLEGRARVSVHYVGPDAGAATQIEYASREYGENLRARLHGRVPHADVRPLLEECHLLALPRPASHQAEGGFPTKLGEYLAIGRPVVVTAVGDIPLYVNENVCFLIEPSDRTALADVIMSCVENYSRARMIGDAGRRVAGSRMSAQYQMQSIVELVYTIARKSPKNGS